IETVLFNWCRGTGLQGLCGMPLVNDFVVRPMLDVSKQDISAYALAHKIQYREDSSNAKLDYTRNKFRHQIVPVLEEIFPSFSQNILANIERMKDTNLIFQQGIQAYRKKLLEQRGKDIYLAVLSLQSMPAVSTVLYELIKEFGFSFDQTLQVLQLINSQSGALVQSQTHKIIRNRKHLIITQIDTQLSDLILIDQEDTHIQTSGFGLQFDKLAATTWSKDKNSELIFVSAKELVYPLVMRKWRQGDYFYPLGFNKKKKVARLLIDEKIPLHEKDEVWVLESEKKIIWVIGHRQDHRFAVKDQDETILKITRTRY
ncbi:MAG: tRNA lysidine(34) synthetase TilS, partial [Chitinophagaceae bacterium]|nr:tRNA lysidine(34) synthetase TilS [Chitinophagaceae bacterium]